MMNFTCHKKVMERLDHIEKRIDYVNSIYTQKYIIVNKVFMLNLCRLTFGIVTILAVYYYFM